jgi:hypothetical protein
MASVFLIAAALATALLIPLPRPAAAEEADLKAMETAYQPDIVPLLATYCFRCHAGDTIEGEIDLSIFKTVGDARKDTKTWQKIDEMLATGQMPPKRSKQPTDAEKGRIQQWVRGFLTAEARAHAGDPGRVVLRRLSNAQYTYTIRDLTGIDSLDPAREFPVDGAAGEGFTNTGNALVMSPALVTKYLDAAKDVAGHAVLLPDGFRFSPSPTRSDWTNEMLAQIRGFYRQFTDPRGGDKVNLQGIVFETNEGGRLPLEKYLEAALAWRAAPQEQIQPLAAFARERGLSPKYLDLLMKELAGGEPSPLMDPIRARWKTAKPGDAGALAADIAPWQKALSKFSSVGHIGKKGGPTRWLEPVSPLGTRQDIRLKLAPTPGSDEVVVTLIASDAGDGNEGDFVVFQQPRLVAPGRPDLPLRDVRSVAAEFAQRRSQLLSNTARYLAAADEAAAAKSAVDPNELAKKHGLDAPALSDWLDYLGVSATGPVKITGHFATKVAKGSGYDFINGWSTSDLPTIIANSSDTHVRVPGHMRGKTVAVHPTPTVRAAVAFQSPIGMTARVEAGVTHAHPECGNGVTWMLELRRGTTRQRLAAGTAQGDKLVKVGPVESVSMQKGDVIALLIGPRDGNHSCDLTAIELTITADDKERTAWSLSQDVSPDILAGNPHDDRKGNKDVWHFFGEPDKDAGPMAPVIPAGSLLAKWRAAAGGERSKLAGEVQALLMGAAPAAKESADAVLHRQLTATNGPLFSSIFRKPTGEKPLKDPAPAAGHWGLDPALFGKHPDGTVIDAASLCVKAPAMMTLRLPADLAAGAELVTSATLDPRTGVDGSVQAQAVPGKPAGGAALTPGGTTVSNANGTWTDNNQRVTFAAPILVARDGAASGRIEAAFAHFRDLFPVALCYTKIVPVDEVVTLTLYHREDDHLARLMLDDAQVARLDRMWDELHYISHDAPALVDALEQLLQFATQDGDPRPFEHLKKVFGDRAAAFSKLLVDTEPKHLDALIAFAGKAYRRALTEAESRDLRGLYARLRAQEINHEDAFRLTLARVLVAPAFLYRAEKPVAGAAQGPVSDIELASRLSYFLWASQPDDELRAVAASGRLRDPSVLKAQTQRMLRDAKTRRLAIEFACQWLHISDFDHLDEKSERHFPTFLKLRGDIYEESIRFFTDLFQNNGTVLGILDADHTFLNEALARHYGIPGVTGAEWRRVEGVKKYGRGGILGQAATLAKQSGASRTSPILRGNWVSEVLLGERLPRPPKDVPQLPDDPEAFAGLTVRQLTEKHSSDARCAVCHTRIDPFGFSLEAFDAIGARREKDSTGHTIDTRTKTKDGVEMEGLEGLRNYLLIVRRDAFVKQFCRKLLGYSLGRAVQLSDEPLLADLMSALKAKDYQLHVAIDMITSSRQFREIRGVGSAYDD